MNGFDVSTIQLEKLKMNVWINTIQSHKLQREFISNQNKTTKILTMLNAYSRYD